MSTSRSKAFLFFTISLTLFLLYVYQRDQFDKSKLNGDIYPSYVVAVKNNKIPLYAEVRGLSRSTNIGFIVTNKTKMKATTFNYIKQNRKTDVIRQLANIHIWYEICLQGIDKLLNYPLFPHLPSQRSFLKNIEMERITVDTGVRIFGYITPSVTNNYLFQLSYQNIDFQFWISKSSEPSNSYLLLYGKYEQRKTHELISQGVQMEKGKKYFFDIVLKSNSDTGKMILKWSSNSGSNWKTLQAENLLPYFDDSNYNSDEVVLEMNYPLNIPMLSNRKQYTNLYSENDLKRSKIFSIPFINEDDIKDLFRICEYKPSYVTMLKYKFQGIWETHYSSVYPLDDTGIYFRLNDNQQKHLIHGNPLLSESLAKKVVKMVLDAIAKKNGRKYSLLSILNVEENLDEKEGSRYLVELELRQEDSSTPVRFSEYVYMLNNQESLCYPKNFKWDKKADVNVILTVGHQGRWAKHFIDTMSRIYNETKDQHLNVIIVDFNSKDIDIVRALKESSIPRYTLLKRHGKFHKTEAIQAAVNTINDDNAITLQVDLHLTIPSDFIDNVRKHTVRGKMTYSPLVARLQCGENPQTPHGFWETSGYGIIGIYKSDWKIIGGMDVEKYRDKWGDEDWDLLDNIINHGYEVERLKIRNFYHVYHSKKGMWNNMIS